MVRQVIILFILLASVTFFRLIFVPRQVYLLLSFASTVFMALAVLIGIIYDRGKGFKQNFALEVGLMLLAVVGAMFGAYFGHGQNFLLSAWAQNDMYFYFFYFFLHLVRIRPEMFMRLLIFLAGFYAFLFFVQYAIFPVKIVSVGLTESRGTVRIFIPGYLNAEIIFFFFLLLFFRTNNLLYAGISFIYLIIVVLLGTRQILLITGFSILVVLLISRQVRSRLSMILLISAGAVLIFFIFQDIFIQLIEVSKAQSAQEEDDIRIRSARFFLTEFQPHWINYILGNGVGHQASAYGLKIWYYKDVYGYYQSDLGLIGSYSMYGVLSVISVFLILRKIWIIKVEPMYVFIKFWAVSLLLTSILSWPFFRPDSIVAIMSGLYLIDVSNYTLKVKQLEKVKEMEEGNIPS